MPADDDFWPNAGKPRCENRGPVIASVASVNYLNFFTLHEPREVENQRQLEKTTSGRDVKRNAEVTVKEHVASVAKQLGDEITIRRFVRFQVGDSAAA